MTSVTQERDRLVAEHAYLCARAGRKFRRPGLERADLEQIAAIGLIKATDRYDARLSTPFEAFAWLFIVGELMHYVRDYERIVRPPRSLRGLEKKYQHAYDALVCELDREPTREELAQWMGIDPGRVDEISRYREQAVSESLESLHPSQLQPCAYTLEDRDERMLLDAALLRLTPTERQIILALYTGYSQVEVATRLGYSRRHISRLHRNALKKMRPVWVAQKE